MSTDTEVQDVPPAETDASPVPAPAGRDHPYFERYGVALLLPLAIVAGVLFFALNVSRIFLALTQNGAVVVGTVITVAILTGAALLSAGTRMSSAGRALTVALLLGGVTVFGWILVGSAEEKGEEAAAGLPDEGGALAELAFTSQSALKFVPAAAEAPTGIDRVTLTNEGGEHTFVFEDPRATFRGLAVASPGESDAGRVFFPEAGDYVFYCSIPGHRAAGMEGVITVSGDTKALADAEAEVAGGGASGAMEGGGMEGGGTPTMAATGGMSGA